MWSYKTKGEDFILDLASTINKFQKERDDLIKGHQTLLGKINKLETENTKLIKENKILRDDLFELSQYVNEWH
jgi:uncharacterized protein YoxC